MRYKWLNQDSNNRKVLLFFNGWGMDECVVKHLDCEDYDVLMFYDYNSLETDFDFDLLKTYTEIALIAWSMGTMIATLFPQINSKNRTAINGTLKSIDTEYGITLFENENTYLCQLGDILLMKKESKEYIVLFQLLK